MESRALLKSALWIVGVIFALLCVFIGYIAITSQQQANEFEANFATSLAEAEKTETAEAASMFTSVIMFKTQHYEEQSTQLAEESQAEIDALNTETAELIAQSALELTQTIQAVFPSASPEVLAKLAGVCSGESSYSDAPAFDSSTSLHPIVVLKDRPGFYPHPLYIGLPVNWQAQDLTMTQLVACLSQGSSLVEECHYMGSDYVLRRIKRTLVVRLLTAREDREVASVILYGDDPGSCPVEVAVRPDEDEGEVWGPDVEIGALEEWLAPYVARQGTPTQAGPK